MTTTNVNLINMDLHSLMYFEPHKDQDGNSLPVPYCVAISESGQVFYCEADENKKPTGSWRLVKIDLKEISTIH